ALLRWSFAHRGLLFTTILLGVGAAAYGATLLPRTFLPPFNEGTLTISLGYNPGIALAESHRLGLVAENLIKDVPEVITVGRRTGRAELDEHAEGVHSSEIDLDLKRSDRSKEEVMGDIRARLAVLAAAVGLTAGSEAERYLRTLQVAGLSPLYPWSLRSFSPAEIDRLVPGDTAHPWGARFGVPADSTSTPALRFIRPSVRAIYNSSFPSGGANDGAVWAGRGVTGVLTAGTALRAGPLSLRLEPLVFWAENRAFELMPNRQTGDLRFADPDHPVFIDLPQRFGDGAYARVDPGQSTLRLDAFGVAAGVSSANQVWGPAADLPMILGANAAGFPHAFLGSSGPLPVGIGRLHGRLVWGDLAQSDYSRVTGPGSRRFMTGWVLTFLPHGLDGLEVGASRFFHNHWPADGLGASDFLQPLQPFLKEKLKKSGVGEDKTSDTANQLAALHFRWVLPRGGFELYGEYGREDHSWDVRDFLLQPDHISAYLLGGRKAWVRGGELLSLRAEVVESQVSHLREVRPQGPFYVHPGGTYQGHTVRGQILGSPAVYGGGGSIVALESHSRGGRWHLDWTRTRVRGGRSALDPRVDVIHSLGAEALLFRAGLDATLGVRGSWELNRHYQGDAFNLTTELGLRARI
ncbi:MAG: efflux RND transporter permease subunit, partial [Gemmatimonadetes bacterium]|nr:efflux RND transporter permease subunit [Gemmatimonadota bacterium]